MRTNGYRVLKIGLVSWIPNGNHVYCLKLEGGGAVGIEEMGV